MGRVEDGTTVCDYDPEEQKRGISLSLAVAPFEWRDHKVNLIDTPGYADFMGDVAAALRIADLAVFVVSAVDGVQVQTEEAWTMAARLGVPRLAFVNKLDRERASFDATLPSSDRLGAGIALELPIGQEAGFRGIADLLTDTAHIYHEGVPHRGDPRRHGGDRARGARRLVEGIVVADDAMLERYWRATPALDELSTPCTTASPPPRCSRWWSARPPAIGDRPPGRLPGRDRPSPLDRPATSPSPGNGDTPRASRWRPRRRRPARRLQDIADPYVGQVSLFRVLSGTCGPTTTWSTAAPAATSGSTAAHRAGQGAGAAASELVAGDIGAVPSLPAPSPATRWPPGQARGRPRSSSPSRRWPWRSCPARRPTRTAGPALHRLVDEDPHCGSSGSTRPTRRCCTARARPPADHPEKLTRKFGANVDTEVLRVPYRETITGSAKDVEGRHKKQTGGHGQFGVCVIDLEPLPRGAGFEFASTVVGGAISRSYITAVQKGIEETMSAGGVYGYPVVDVGVTVTDGKEHSVDSSEMAFKVAGRLAFRAAMAQANPVVLEPISRLEVTVPIDLQGDVMGDLNARRGRVQGTDTAEDGRQTVIALVPTSEIQRYAIELRLTGAGVASHPRPLRRAARTLVATVKREVGEETEYSEGRWSGARSAASTPPICAGGHGRRHPLVRASLPGPLTAAWRVRTSTPSSARAEPGCGRRWSTPPT
jgi:elongation factor G